MGLFSRRKKKDDRIDLDAAVVAHLDDFRTSRRGVEAYIELPTTVTKATLLLVAHDGEWTRRSVDSVEWARNYAAARNLPAYDAGVVGYPQRMRDYNARERAKAKAAKSS